MFDGASDRVLGVDPGLAASGLAVLAREGSSLLLVEQYVTRALELADYVYTLKKGSVGFRGEPAELDGEDVFSEYLGQSAAEPAVNGQPALKGQP